jgi:multisubunit Na+/H+ antiporter MnhG subunit
VIIANAFVLLVAVGIFVGTLALGRARDHLERTRSRDGEE